MQNTELGLVFSAVSLDKLTAYLPKKARPNISFRTAYNAGWLTDSEETLS